MPGALDELTAGGERVLDIGTGSGILAIAALKLGAACAEGVDIDPVAVRTACEECSPERGWRGSSPAWWGI